jgi:hypothetical protein
MDFPGFPPRRRRNDERSRGDEKKQLSSMQATDCKLLISMLKSKPRHVLVRFLIGTRLQALRCQTNHCTALTHYTVALNNREGEYATTFNALPVTFPLLGERAQTRQAIIGESAWKWDCVGGMKQR